MIILAWNFVVVHMVNSIDCFSLKFSGYSYGDLIIVII